MVWQVMGGCVAMGLLALALLYPATPRAPMLKRHPQPWPACGGTKAATPRPL